MVLFIILGASAERVANQFGRLVMFSFICLCCILWRAINRNPCGRARFVVLLLQTFNFSHQCLNVGRAETPQCRR